MLPIRKAASVLLVTALTATVACSGDTISPIGPRAEPQLAVAPMNASVSSAGIYIDPSALAALPMSGAAWSNLKSTADRDCAALNLADQNQSNNVCILAKALVFGRTQQPAYRAAVVEAIRTVATAGTYNGRALALGRELAAYVIAADIINLADHDAGLDRQFREKLAQLRTTYTSGGPKNLVDCHEKRANNWGTMCGASRIAISAYLGDAADLSRAATVFRGFLGDRTSYAGFKYGSTSWQCDASRPVGINPKGCSRSGVSLDGVLPDDQRRGGDFTWPAPKENYVYEALQGALTQAVLLRRQGYDVWNWGDQALLRAFVWEYQTNNFPATGDDGWMPHLVNSVYGTRFAAPNPSRPGKVLGWTDWTHAAR